MGGSQYCKTSHAGAGRTCKVHTERPGPFSLSVLKGSHLVSGVRDEWHFTGQAETQEVTSSFTIQNLSLFNHMVCWILCHYSWDEPFKELTNSLVCSILTKLLDKTDAPLTTTAKASYCVIDLTTQFRHVHASHQSWHTHQPCMNTITCKTHIAHEEDGPLMHECKPRMHIHQNCLHIHTNMHVVQAQEPLHPQPHPTLQLEGMWVFSWTRHGWKEGQPE